MVESPANVVRIRQISGRSILRLKSWMPSGQIVVAGVQLLNKAGATASRGDFSVLCTGPGDSLLVSSQKLSSRVREQIMGAAMNQGLALVDLTSGISVIEISGAGARDILVRGCGLDFGFGTSPAFQCARTRLACVAVVIDMHYGTDAIDLYVARSHEAWLNDWLADAASGVG